MSSKADTRAKLEFIEALLSDAALSPSARCIAVALLTIWRNGDTGQTNPGLGTIGKRLGIARRTVVDAIAELTTSGWMETRSTSGGSLYNTNRYRFDIYRRPPASSASATGAKNATSAKSAPVQKATSTGANFANEPLREPREALRPLSGRETPPRRRAADAAPPEAWAEFSRLWARGHPDDPVEVRRAFDEAIAEHGAEAIMASARAWAAAYEPRYRPNPLSWLAGAWQAEPPEKPHRVGAARRSGRKPTVAEVGAACYAKARMREGQR